MLRIGINKYASIWICLIFSIVFHGQSHVYNSWFVFSDVNYFQNLKRPDGFYIEREYLSERSFKKRNGVIAEIRLFEGQRIISKWNNTYGSYSKNEFQYDSLNRLIFILCFSPKTNRLSRSIEICYEGNNLLPQKTISVSSGKKYRVEFTFDSLDRVVSEKKFFNEKFDSQVEIFYKSKNDDGTYYSIVCDDLSCDTVEHRIFNKFADIEQVISKQNDSSFYISFNFVESLSTVVFYREKNADKIAMIASEAVKLDQKNKESIISLTRIYGFNESGYQFKKYREIKFFSFQSIPSKIKNKLSIE